MPHRHGHDLARPARRVDDGSRLLPCVAGRGSPPLRGDAAGVEFVEADLYDAVEAVQGEKFDLVFTGVGALCWLPDIRVGEVVADLLRPGGRLFIREGHPMLWALDDPREDGSRRRVPLLRARRADGRDGPGTYVSTDVAFEHNVTTSGTTGSARSSPPSSTTASS